MLVIAVYRLNKYNSEFIPNIHVWKVKSVKLAFWQNLLLGYFGKVTYSF